MKTSECSERTAKRAGFRLTVKGQIETHYYAKTADRWAMALDLFGKGATVVRLAIWGDDRRWNEVDRIYPSDLAGLEIK